MKYANDLLLTDLARRITNEMAEVNTMLMNGALTDAREKAETMRANLLGLIVRLGDLTQERL